MHSAKGLEWKAVFILWAAEGWFPSEMASHDTQDMEEERRLMYVAVTRAQKYLFVFYPKTAVKRGEGRVWVRPSRFIEHLMNSGSPKTYRNHKKGTSDLLLDITLKYGRSLTGRRVSHATFGTGIVIGHQGVDNVTVNFESKGLISLNLKYAPLTVIED